MIFSERSINAIVNGDKTQTRRLAESRHFELQEDGKIVCVMHSGNSWRHSVKWKVDNTYAVQPGRSEKGVTWIPNTMEWFTKAHLVNNVERTKAALGLEPLRLRILSIRREDVREISAVDVAAEGFECLSDWLLTWASLHDKTIQHQLLEATWLDMHVPLWLWQRPNARYECWAITFEIVE